MRLFDRPPARYFAPNMVTCLGLVFGLASIRTSLMGRVMADFHQAAWFILYAVLLDKLDGAVARRLKASSEIGVQLDSFSDFVTFGLAPAALVTAMVPHALPDPWATGAHHAVLLGLGAMYAVAAALRLAKFNVTTATIGPRFFMGLPSTSSGGLLASAFLAHHELGLPTAALAGMVAFLGLNAVLMVSNLPMPKLHISRNPLFKTVQIAVVAAVYVLVPLHRFPTFLIAAAALYTVGGFIYGWHVTKGGTIPGSTDDEEEEDEDPRPSHAV